MRKILRQLNISCESILNPAQWRSSSRCQLIGIILKRRPIYHFSLPPIYLDDFFFSTDRNRSSPLSQTFSRYMAKFYFLPVPGYFFATLTWICETSTVGKPAGVHRFARFIEMAATFQTTKAAGNGGSSPIAISEHYCNRANYNKNLRARLNDRADYR